MRKAIGLITSIVLVFTISCNDKPIEPFQLSVSDYNYSLAYSVLYKISDEQLLITFRGELENEKDSILYSTKDLPIQYIRQLSNINIDSLNVLYSTLCIRDGDIKSFRFKKNGISKTILLENYYHPELSPAIEIINEMVPEKYIINYNKEWLMEAMRECGEYQIIKNWEDYKNNDL